MAPSKKTPARSSSTKKSSAKKTEPATEEQTLQGDTLQVPPTEPQTTESMRAPAADTKASPPKTAPRSRKASQSRVTPSQAAQTNPAEAPPSHGAAKQPVVLVPSYQPLAPAQSSKATTPPASSPTQQATKKRHRSSAIPKAPELPLKAFIEQLQTTNPPKEPAQPKDPAQPDEYAQPKQEPASQPLPQASHGSKEIPVPVPKVPVPKVPVPKNILPQVQQLSEQPNQPAGPKQAVALTPLPSEQPKESAGPKQAESRKPLPSERPKQPSRAQKRPPAQRQWATIADQALLNPSLQLPTATGIMPRHPKKQKVMVPDKDIDPRTGFRKGVVVSSSLKPQVGNGCQNGNNHVQGAQPIPQSLGVSAQNSVPGPSTQNIIGQAAVNNWSPTNPPPPAILHDMNNHYHKVMNLWFYTFLQRTQVGRDFVEGKRTREDPNVQQAYQTLIAKIAAVPYPFVRDKLRLRIILGLKPPAPGTARPQVANQIQPPQLPQMNFPGWHHEVPQPRAQQPPQASPMNLPRWNHQNPQQQVQQQPQASPMNLTGQQGSQQQAQQIPQHHPMHPLGMRVLDRRVEVRPGVWEYPQVVSPPTPVEEEREEVRESGKKPIHETQDAYKIAESLGVKINMGSRGVAELLDYQVKGAKALLSKNKGAPKQDKHQAEQTKVEIENTLRQNKVTRNILRSLHEHLPNRTIKPVGPAYPSQMNAKVMPTFQELALGHIKPCNPNSGNPLEHCTFCTFDCDFGIANDFFLLPVEASGGYCPDCSTKEWEFFEEWTQRARPDHGYPDPRDRACAYQLHMKGFQQSHPLEVLGKSFVFVQAAAKYQIAKPTLHNTLSNLDGMDIRAFREIRFCGGNPWTQVDVTRARICVDCKDEKLKILQHRHREFERIVRDDEMTKKDRRCMLCANSAYEKCAECPLRLCGTCVASVRNAGKGWINNAIYAYNRVHLRNDAFLLRSDGGGF